MATLKINASHLPYRGEPTKDTRPTTPKIPPHLKVTVLEGPWSREKKSEAIKARKERAQRNSKYHHPNAWTDEADEKLKQLYLAGEDYEVICEALGRSRKAVQIRLSGLRARGVDLPHRVPQRDTHTWYTEADDALIIKMHNAGRPTKEIAQMLGRTEHGVNTRMVVLRQKGYYLPDTRGKQGNRRKKGSHE